MQGASLKILGSEAKGNKTKQMNYFSLNRSYCVFFFALYRSALDPRMNFNKFATGTLSCVTGRVRGLSIKRKGFTGCFTIKI